jgi:hypothetical protein
MARVALELSEAGFTVEVLCPRGHAVEELPFVAATYRYKAFAPIASLRAAIVTSRPSLLVPYDDHVTAQLHELYECTDPGEQAGLWLRALIARSLGEPEHFSLLYSRYHICSLARDLGISVPTTEAVANKASLMTALNSVGSPAVLKSDGSWGGRGVVAVNNYEAAVRAFRRLSAPPAASRALKRLVIDRDPTLIVPCLHRRRQAVSIQRFVRGRPANAAVACWQGKVLAAVLVEVLCSNGATGPATVVRIMSHPGMLLVIERMVDRLQLSGLCGFDFVLSEEDGSIHFLELNPRATPTCHLVAADGKHLLAALHAALRRSRPSSWQSLPIRSWQSLPIRRKRSRVEGGEASSLRRTPCLEPIALFPQEMIRDPHSPHLRSAYHDVPWQSPELVKLGHALRKTNTGSIVSDFRRFAIKSAGDSGNV